MVNKINMKWSAMIVLVIVVSLARLIPNMPNFSPMAAIALFSAAHFDKWWKSLLVTLFATFLSDMVLNNTIYAYMNNGFTVFYDGFYWQYLAYALIVLLGSAWFSTISIGRVVTASLGTTLVFFLVSNFGAMMSLPMYSKDVAGLMTSYLAGLPFLKNTFLSDFLYSIMLFGVYYFIQNRFESFRISHLRYA